ncbi:peptidase associated/transthyretin-like domain-containing protein [Paraliomyxa miuraensis]|uniref:hypothetical protein n=1 Tax=Paraliomyxa miuraensis TaxID=376150 RepID=UPI0022525A73|nr:hypothetical protein [Paraliomyxa miuraensis]MCX4247578.1 hypothetical protein [Paraliomyxa miuraensis]
MSRPLPWALALGLGLGLAVASPGPAATAAVLAAGMGCSDSSGLCVDSGGASFTADKKSTSKDRKKRSTKNAGTLSLSIDGGRGSVFLNGRYVGTAPVSGVELPSGKNDLQVRDGADVLATGLLDVPKGAAVSITVNGG